MIRADNINLLVAIIHMIRLKIIIKIRKNEKKTYTELKR